MPGHSSSEDVVRNLIQWGFGFLDSEENRWITYFEKLESQARTTLLSIENGLVVAEANKLLDLAKDKLVVYELANFISKIDPSNHKALNILSNLLSDPEIEKDEWLRLQAANSLIQSCSGYKSAEKALVKLSRYSKNEWIRVDAAWSMLTVDPRQPDAIRALINLLCTSRSENTLGNLDLHKIGANNPRLISTLLKMCYSGQTPKIRSVSLTFLLQILADDESLFERVKRLIEI